MSSRIGKILKTKGSVGNKRDFVIIKIKQEVDVHFPDGSHIQVQRKAYVSIKRGERA